MTFKNLYRGDAVTYFNDTCLGDDVQSTDQSTFAKRKPSQTFSFVFDPLVETESLLSILIKLKYHKIRSHLVWNVMTRIERDVSSTHSNFPQHRVLIIAAHAHFK